MFAEGFLISDCIIHHLHIKVRFRNSELEQKTENGYDREKKERENVRKVKRGCMHDSEKSAKRRSVQTQIGEIQRKRPRKRICGDHDYRH